MTHNLDALRLLNQFTGSAEFYQHRLIKKVIYTEGVKYLADHAECHWLIDMIASHLVTKEFNKAARQDERIASLSFWKLAMNADKTGNLTAVADPDEPAFISQHFYYAKFPLPEISIWAGINELGGYTLMLPSEY